MYDESENLIPYSEIYESSEIIGILEILGIKFSARSFQIEIELKQLMKINSDKIFNNCKINTDLKIIEKKEPTEELASLTKNENNELSIENQVEVKDLDLNEIKIENDSDNEEITKPENLAKKEEQEINIEPIPSLINDIGNTDLFEIDIGDENFNINSNQEVVEPMKLKESDEVYLELYKEAKKKAKEFKKKHLETILEANKIKANYLTDIIIESSDDEIN